MEEIERRGMIIERGRGRGKKMKEEEGKGMER